MSTTVPLNPKRASYVCRYCRLPSNASGTAHAPTAGHRWTSAPPCRILAGSSSRLSGTWPTSSSASPIARSRARSSRRRFQPGAGRGGYLLPPHPAVGSARVPTWSRGPGSFFTRMYAGMPLVLMRASGPAMSPSPRTTRERWWPCRYRRPGSSSASMPSWHPRTTSITRGKTRPSGSR